MQFFKIDIILFICSIINSAKSSDSAETDEVAVDPCKVTGWSEWSECSSSCGKLGVTHRYRAMVYPTKQKKCSTPVELSQQRTCLAPTECPSIDLATARSICTEKIEIGPCRAAIPYWGFDDEQLICKLYRFGGCGKSKNMFSTKEKCESTCGIVKAALMKEQSSNKLQSRVMIDPPTDLAIAKSICMEKIKTGLCRASFRYWSFDAKQLTCKLYTFGGCGKRRNIFSTKEKCESTCGIVKAALMKEQSSNKLQSRVMIDPPTDLASAKKICTEKIEKGLCHRSIPIWAFDTEKLTCVSFRYGSCDMKKNLFATEEECNSTCGIVKADLMKEQSSDPPIDCMMSAWSPWSQCSATCGMGYVTRNRTIMRQPKNGGHRCPNQLQRRARCQLARCD